MELKSTATIAPACDIREVIREMKLTSAESKAINSARERIKTASDIAARFASKETCAKHDRTCPLEVATWDASAAFQADPSEATAEALAAAVVRFQAASAIEASLNGAVEQIVATADKELVSVVHSLCDRAEAQMREQLDAAQGTLDATPALQAEARAFRAKAAAAMQQAKDIRADAIGQPLRFLSWEIGI